MTNSDDAVEQANELTKGFEEMMKREYGVEFVDVTPNRPASPPATEKCECGHGKHAHDANQCYSVLSVTQTQCLCKSYRPPAPEPADANANEAARAFKRVAFELRMRFPVEIQYNSEFEAMVKRLEAGSL